MWKREDELVGIPTHAINEESDVENDSESPMSNCFFSGSQTLMKMSNFNIINSTNCEIIAKIDS